MNLEATRPQIWRQHIHEGRKLKNERYAYLTIGSVSGGLILWALSQLIAGDISGALVWLGASAVFFGAAFYGSREILKKKASEIVCLVPRPVAVKLIVQEFVALSDEEKLRWHLRHTGTDALPIHWPRQ